eukprot:TRINITY_DN4964_c0_g1_i4.p1 TRINITY_DN4964_c0_g1~~TRINITY_DN4964_c0_g1_i4.p1  ORF type:complete len:325 (+),score=141.30 TRINITY_DN4964_c0_g1_i4:78-977(+)
MAAITFDDLMYCADAPKGRQVTIDDFELGAELGQGKYGHVHVARDKTSNALVAIKKLVLDQIVEENVIKQVQREIQIMQTLHHPNILNMYTYFWDENNIYLVLEYAVRGDLWRAMYQQKDKRFDIKTTAKLVAQLCEAIRAAHKQNILHRDIKPENILLDSQGNVKLADFGWSVQDERRERTTYCGTPDYIPPEMLGPEGATEDDAFPYGPEIDNWCIGVFMYECLFGDAPFFSEDDDVRNRKIRKTEYQFPPEPKMPQEAYDLIKGLLKFEPRERMSLDDVLRHPFITKYYRKVTPMP